MICYKCGSEKELSLKRRTKYGNLLFICKSCRRAYYQILKNRNQTKPVSQPLHYDAAEWKLRSQASLDYIISKRK